MARKTGTSIDIIDHISIEEDGSCKCMEKDGAHVTLCGQPTRKSGFHYCPDCYSIIASEFGAKSTKEWPPMRENDESRYCYDYRTENIFLIPNSWMEKYDAKKADGSAIEIKYRKFQRGGNYPCWVYVLKCKDGMHYIGQTKHLKRRIHRHKTNPGKTLQKHDGYQKMMKNVKVNNRDTALALEEFLVQLLRDLGMRATHGFVTDD